MATSLTPVVFIHGLWIHATSWKPWIDFFKAAGYDPIAPPWPGSADTIEAARAHPEQAAGYGVNEIVDHYAKIIGTLPLKPVVIGHSFGGLLAQVILGRNLASAAVAIDAAPIKGVLALPFSALRVASVALKNPANMKKAVSLTAAEFRYGFGNMLSHEDSEELFRRWTIPSPARPLFQAAFANFNPNAATKVDTGNANRGPLLLNRGRGRSHRPAGDHARHAQAVPPLYRGHRAEGNPAPRPFAHDRQGMGRGGDGGARLAEGENGLNSRSRVYSEDLRSTRILHEHLPSAAAGIRSGNGYDAQAARAGTER